LVNYNSRSQPRLELKTSVTLRFFPRENIPQDSGWLPDELCSQVNIACYKESPCWEEKKIILKTQGFEW
jgi:hypothetical protein